MSLLATAVTLGSSGWAHCPGMGVAIAERAPAFVAHATGALADVPCASVEPQRPHWGPGH